MPSDALFGQEDTLRINFAPAALRTAEGFQLQGLAAQPYFTSFDTLRTTVLGTNSAGGVNFIRVQVGAGEVLINTLPLAFTNFHMLDGENGGYAFRALSYLPEQPVRWDGYYKPLRRSASSPMRVILSDEALRSAYYLLLTTLVLFLVFQGRRRQRIIPIIAPPQNTTVAFTETVGRLYYQHGDHANLAAKQRALFLDFVRTRLNLPTHTLDPELQLHVAERSGVPLDEVHDLFARLGAVKDQPRLSAEQLMALSEALEDFYAKSQR